MPNAKVLTRQVFKPLTKEKKLEVWNKVKARIATGEYCDITAKECALIIWGNRMRAALRSDRVTFAEIGLGQTVIHFGVGRLRYPATFFTHIGNV